MSIEKANQLTDYGKYDKLIIDEACTVDYTQVARVMLNIRKGLMFGDEN